MDGCRWWRIPGPDVRESTTSSRPASPTPREWVSPAGAGVVSWRAGSSPRQSVSRPPPSAPASATGSVRAAPATTGMYRIGISVANTGQTGRSGAAVPRSTLWRTSGPRPYFSTASRDQTSSTNQTMVFFDALQELGIPTRFIKFPRQKHGIREPRLLRVRVIEEIRWMQKYVRGPRLVTLGSTGPGMR